MKRRWLKLVLITSTAFILVLLSVLILVQTQAFSGLLLDRARNYLRNSDIDLHASSLHVDLLRKPKLNK